MPSNSNSGDGNERRQRNTNRRSSTSNVLQGDLRHPQMAVRRASTFTTTTLSSWSNDSSSGVPRRGSAGESLSVSRRGSAASTLSMSSIGESSFLLIDEDLLAEITSPRVGRRDSLLSIIGTAIDIVETNEENALGEQH